MCLHCYSISSQASVDVFSFVSNYLLFCLCNAFCTYLYNNALLWLYDLICVHVCILLSTSCKVLFMTSESCLVIVMYLGIGIKQLGHWQPTCFSNALIGRSVGNDTICLYTVSTQLFLDHWKHPFVMRVSMLRLKHHRYLFRCYYFSGLNVILLYNRMKINM